MCCSSGQEKKEGEEGDGAQEGEGEGDAEKAENVEGEEEAEGAEKAEEEAAAEGDEGDGEEVRFGSVWSFRRGAAGWSDGATWMGFAGCMDEAGGSFGWMVHGGSVPVCGLVRGLPAQGFKGAHH